MIKKIIRLNLDDLLLPLGILGGVFVLLHLVTAVILLFFKPDGSIQISGVLLPCLAGMLVLILAFTHSLLTFEDALRHSVTRRRALAGVTGLILFEGAVTFCLAGLLTLLERLFSPALWTLLTGAPAYVLSNEPQRIPAPVPGAPIPPADPDSALFIQQITFPWWVFVLIALGCALTGLVIGALIQRFGRKAGWLLWGLLMALMIFQKAIPWSAFLSVQWVPYAGLLAALALIFWSLWSMLHAVVKR